MSDVTKQGSVPGWVGGMAEAEQSKRDRRLGRVLGDRDEASEGHS